MTESYTSRLSSDGDHQVAEGWSLPRIGEILVVNYGKGLPEKRRLPGKVHVYGSNGVIGYHSKPLTNGSTIIVGRKGTVGAVHFSQEPCWPIDTTYFIEQFNGLDPIYVYFGLKYLNLPELDTSTAIPGLNRDELYGQRLPLAPFAEQKRIVEKIQELLARVNATRERLAKVPAILKRFRQAVFAAACSGRQTEEWRTEHVAKSRSIETEGSDIRESPRTPAGWRWLTIDKLSSSLPRSIQSGPFGSNLHHSEFQETGVLAIGIDNVLAGKFAMGKEHRISEKKYKELEKYRARPLDVLITVMATVGRCVLFLRILRQQ